MQNNFYALLYEIIDASSLHNTKARISALMIKVDVRQPWFEIISYDTSVYVDLKFDYVFRIFFNN